MELTSTIKSVAEVFGLTGDTFKSAKVRVYDNPDAPEINPGYKFTEDVFSRLIVWAASGSAGAAFGFKQAMKRNLMIYGPTGCGKTELMKQFAARTGRTVFRFQCSEDTETEQLFGTWKLCKTADGGTEMTYVDGEVLRWARTPNSILILDEVDQLRPTVKMALNGILDGDIIEIPETGERLRIGQGCLLSATANTNGRGSATANGGAAALYKGAKRQNIASLDRYFVIEATYLDEASEKDLLVEQTGIEATFAEAMAKLATQIRSQFIGLNEDAGANGEPLDFTLTTRNLLNWAMAFRLMVVSVPTAKALEESLRMTLLDFATAGERQAVLDAFSNIVGS